MPTWSLQNEFWRLQKCFWTQQNLLRREHRIGDDLDDDGSDALAENAELLSSTPGEVDDTPTAKGTAIGDAHHDNTIVSRIGDTQARAKGMGAVGTGQAVVMQPLAATGESSRRPLAVVGGDAFLRLAIGQTK